jgi:hypothetical protein
MVAHFVADWRKTGSVARPKAPERISPKHAAILVTRAADQMTDEQQRLFDRITEQCPEAGDLRRIALAFRAALTADNSIQLRQWIEGAKRCEFGPVVRFAYGLQKDISAVSAAVDTSWSTGQVEGQINRLKMIKRQMYGRAGFELLRARVLPYSTLDAFSDRLRNMHQNRGRAHAGISNSHSFYYRSPGIAKMIGLWIRKESESRIRPYNARTTEVARPAPGDWSASRTEVTSQV